MTSENTHYTLGGQLYTAHNCEWTPTAKHFQPTSYFSATLQFKPYTKCINYVSSDFTL